MPIQLDGFRPDVTLPDAAEVVVIGGGIVGASAAFALARAGIPAVLCEKGEIGAEQSGRNWGWCRTMGRDPAEIPLSLESLRIWRNLDALVGAETGFVQAGTLYLSDDAADLARHEKWLDHARPYQIDTRLLSSRQLAQLLPGANRAWAGGLHTPADGRAEPGKATPAIAAAARRHGAVVATGCAARGIETEGGAVSAVVTEKGTVRCRSVILAGGAWSRLFCGNHGIDLPQLKVLGSVIRTAPLSGPPEVAVGASDFSFRKRLDGGYSIARRNASVSEITPDTFRLFRDFLPSLASSWHELRLRIGRRFLTEWRTPRRWRLDEVTPFERVRILDPEPAQSLLREGLANARRAFPAFASATVAGSWGGLIDVTPDAVPVISPVARLPGLILATGFSGHGFGIGPAAGQLAADLATGATPIVDPSPFVFDRFTRPRAPHGVSPSSRHGG